MPISLTKVSLVIPKCPRCGSGAYVATDGAFGKKGALRSLNCCACGEDILAAYVLLGVKPVLGPLVIALAAFGIAAVVGLAVVLTQASAHSLLAP